MFSQYENSHHFIIDSSNKNSQKATVKMYSFSLLFFWKTSPRRELKLCRAPTVRQWAETLVGSCIYTRRQCVFPFRLMSSLRIGCDSRILHSPHMPANDQAKLWLKKKTEKRENIVYIWLFRAAMFLCNDNSHRKYRMRVRERMHLATAYACSGDEFWKQKLGSVSRWMHFYSSYLCTKITFRSLGMAGAGSVYHFP